MDAESIRKTLKIFNFPTANAILMRLAPDIYLYKVFHLVKSLDIKMSRKIDFLVQFRPFLNTSINAVGYLMHHLACHH